MNSTVFLKVINLEFQSLQPIITFFLFLFKSYIWNSNETLILSRFDQGILLQNKAVCQPVHSLMHNQSNRNIQLMQLDSVISIFKSLDHHHSILKPIFLWEHSLIKAISDNRSLITVLHKAKCILVKQCSSEWNFNLFSFKNIDLIRIRHEFFLSIQSPINALLPVHTIDLRWNIIHVFKRSKENPSFSISQKISTFNLSVHVDMVEVEFHSHIILWFPILTEHVENIPTSALSQKVIKELMRVLMISQIVVILRVKLLLFTFRHIHKLAFILNINSI